jgi:peptidoglycan pentaglycine glycine transferase (the first glycine)
VKLHLKLLSDLDRYAWDGMVKANPHSCFMQSWTWADFKELQGYKTWRYGLFCDEGATSENSSKFVVGGCIFYLYPQSGGANILLATGGVILSSEWAALGMPLLLEVAEHLAYEYSASFNTSIIALRIEPLWESKPQWLPVDFVRSPADLMPTETLLIDLQLTTDQLLAQMQPKGRYNLRLSWRYGVTTEFRQDDAAIALFYDLFWETSQRQNFFGEPFGFFINLCQTLFPENMAEIGIASWQGEALAAILVIYWGDRCIYLYGGRSDQHRHVMASYAIHWAAMQQAKARGCKIYDFYGFTTDPDHSYFQFSRFKQQFGGAIAKTIGAHDYVFYDRLADTIIGLLEKL